VIVPTGGSGTFVNPTVNLGNNAFEAGGSGFYDIYLDFELFPPSAQFGPNDVLELTATLDGLTAASFVALSTDDGQLGPYYGAARIKGIHSDFFCLPIDHGWITQEGVTPFPEPATLSMLALGSVGMLIRRK